MSARKFAVAVTKVPANDGGEQVENVHIIEPATGFQIALMCDADSTEDVLPDARLLAAAPALLAALRAIVQQPVGHTAKDSAKDLAACCRIARESIESLEWALSRGWCYWEHEGKAKL